ncbi:MAG: hypothetical protein LC658_11545, partial [Bacteroidales bacterium]|nr:hypothetical protein [Bacteroidales bacterium]
MERTKILETGLVLTTAFLVIYLITGNNVFLYLALTVGLLGIFIKPVAKYIAIAWFKLAGILNFFVSRIILGTLFFIILFPISLLYKIPNKDNLRLKRSDKSTWNIRNHTYSSGDLE